MSKFNDNKKKGIELLDMAVTIDIDMHNDENEEEVNEPCEVDPEIESFYKYYFNLRIITAKELNTIFKRCDVKNKNLQVFSRDMRRKAEKLLASSYDKSNTLKEIKEVFCLCDDIVAVTEDKDNWFDKDEEFARLIFADLMYQQDDKTLIDSDKGKSKDILKYYIKKTLTNKGDCCSFLKCFDDDANVKVEMAYYLRSLLYNLYRSLSKNNTVYNCADIDEYVSSLISDELLEEADIYNAKMKEIKQQEQERIKEEKRLEKERLKEQQQKKKEEIVVIKKVYNEQDELYNKIINSSTYSLRKGIDEIVSLEELEKTLEKLDKINKEDKIRFIEEYKNRVRDKRINYILKIVSKSDLKKLRVILKNEKEHKDIMNIINNQLISDGFEEYSDEQIKETINSILNKNYLKKTTTIENYIIFPDDKLVNEEVNRVLTSKTMENRQTVIKSLQNHLLTLELHDLNEIKSNKNNAFHELMINHSAYSIGNKLKGYRYGARKTKIGVFILSVCAENQEKLQEIYKTNINTNAILVYGMGNVIIEKECDLMTRLKKQGLEYQEQILHINEIFANPFSDETLEEAKKLINDGLLTIQNISGFDDNSNVKKCTI